jgi:hypothetical protein
LAALSILQKQIAEAANSDFSRLFTTPDTVSKDPFHE